MQKPAAMKNPCGQSCGRNLDFWLFFARGRSRAGKSLSGI